MSDIPPADGDVVRRLDNIERTIREKFIGSAFPNAPAIKTLSPEESSIHARKAFQESKGVRLIDEAMRRRGLLRNLERSTGHTVFSRKLSRQKGVTVVPYSPHDPKSEFVGGIGLSENQPPSAIIVRLDGTKVVSYFTLDIRGDNLVEKQFDVSQFLKKPIEELAKEDGVEHNENFVHEIEVGDSINIASNVLKILVTDAHSASVHSPEDTRSFMSNDGIVRSIAELQFLRIKGTHFSPDASCCSCCCCCWGSCSSCSAISMNYANKEYFPAMKKD